MKKILKDRLLVEKIKIEAKKSILDTIPEENGPLTGKVLKKGSLVEDINEGDLIYFKESDSYPITIDNNTFLILREYDIIGII